MRWNIVLVGLLVVGGVVRAEEQKKAFRPPAVPLVVCNPYFSIWSEGDKLTDVETRHWTGKPHRLTSMVRVDGKAYRLMGAEPKDVPAMEQTSVRVMPTQTIYLFEDAG